MCIPFHIPVKPHIKKYLIHCVGSPYKMSEGDFVGMFLSKALKYQEDDRSDLLLVSRYKERFTVNVSVHDVYYRNLNSVTGTTVLHFNSFVNAIFRRNFITWMDVVSLSNYMDMKQAVDVFKNIYGITEDDLSWDALYKYYYRYRKESCIKNLCI